MRFYVRDIPDFTGKPREISEYWGRSAVLPKPKMLPNNRPGRALIMGWDNEADIERVKKQLQSLASQYTPNPSKGWRKGAPEPRRGEPAQQAARAMPKPPLQQPQTDDFGLVSATLAALYERKIAQLEAEIASLKKQIGAGRGKSFPLDPGGLARPN